MGSNGEWQQVVDTQIEVAELEAYNLTVDGYSTYFVAGDESAEGVWVHNKCFDKRSDFSDFDEIDTKTEFGQKQFKGLNDEIIYEGHDGKFYTKKDHPPTRNPKVVFDENKFEYLFGRVTSSPHNEARSSQLRDSLLRLGIGDTPASRELLRNHFKSDASPQSTNVTKTYTDQYGNFEIRESLLAGPNGKFVKLVSTYKIEPDGSRTFSTTIRK